MSAEFDFDNPPDRRGTDSRKWARYAGRDVLPLWVADMDFAAPPCVLEALHARVDHAVFGYGDPPASLTEAVIAALAEDFQWDVRPEWLVWLPGLVPGLNAACRAVGESGDAVLTAVPIYPPFLTAPLFSQRTCIRLPLALTGQHWRWNFDALRAAVTPRTRLLMLCSPHNPVGRAWSREELLALARIAEEHDLVVCSDEIHADLMLVPDRRHIPFASLGAGLAERTITLMAPSKTYNIPGLGCSFAVVANPALRRRLRHALRGIVPDVNVLGFAAAEAAYRHGGSWRRALLAYLRGNAALVHDAINDTPGLSMAPVEATYLAWVDARGLGHADPHALFERAGVGLSRGDDFGAPGFVRINFGCSRALLREALSRIRRAAAGS
jgi:cystathionine beta-lyase